MLNKSIFSKIAVVLLLFSALSPLVIAAVATSSQTGYGESLWDYVAYTNDGAFSHEQYSFFEKYSKACVQVITTAHNTKTGECIDFPTPCDVPAGWVRGCPKLEPTENYYELAAETLYKDQQSYEIKKANHVANNQRVFDLIINKLSLIFFTNPTEDFTKYTVLAAFMGQKSTGGYNVNISRVVDVGDKVFVGVKEIQPSGGLVVQALTNPAHVVRIPKTTKPVEFVSLEELNEKLSRKRQLSTFNLINIYCSQTESSAFVYAPYTAEANKSFEAKFKLRAVPLKNSEMVCENKQIDKCNYIKQTVQSCNPADSICGCEEIEAMCVGALVCTDWRTPDYCDNLAWEPTYYPCNKTVCTKEYWECKKVEEPAKYYFSYNLTASAGTGNTLAKEYNGNFCLDISCKNYAANFMAAESYLLQEGNHSFSVEANVVNGKTIFDSNKTFVSNYPLLYPELNQKIQIPEEEIELDSWIDAYDYSNSETENSECESSAESGSCRHDTVTQRFTANKTAGINKYELDAYIFQRVLIYPDGREVLIDANKFDNHIATEKERMSNGYYQYFAEYTLPEKNLSLEKIEPGKYKIEVRRIQIPALTAEKNPNAGVDSVLDLYDAKPVPYTDKIETYNMASGDGSRRESYTNYGCTLSSNREYTATRNFTFTISKNTDCPYISLKSIKNLGCKFEYIEYLYRNSYGWSWSPYGSSQGISESISNSKNCWFELLVNKSVRLKDLEEVVSAYEYSVADDGITFNPTYEYRRVTAGETFKVGVEEGWKILKFDSSYIYQTDSQTFRAEQEGQTKIILNKVDREEGMVEIKTIDVIIETALVGSMTSPFALASGESENENSNRSQTNNSGSNRLPVPLAMLAGAALVGVGIAGIRTLGKNKISEYSQISLSAKKSTAGKTWKPPHSITPEEEVRYRAYDEALLKAMQQREMEGNKVTTWMFITYPDWYKEINRKKLFNNVDYAKYRIIEGANSVKDGLARLLIRNKINGTILNTPTNKSNAFIFSDKNSTIDKSETQKKDGWGGFARNLLKGIAGWGVLADEKKVLAPEQNNAASKTFNLNDIVKNIAGRALGTPFATNALNTPTINLNKLSANEKTKLLNQVNRKELYRDVLIIDKKTGITVGEVDSLIAKDKEITTVIQVKKSASAMDKANRQHTDFESLMKDKEKYYGKSKGDVLVPGKRIDFSEMTISSEAKKITVAEDKYKEALLKIAKNSATKSLLEDAPKFLRNTKPILRTAGRFAVPVALAADAYFIKSSWDEDGGKFGRNTTKAVGESAGAWGGFFAGAATVAPITVAAAAVPVVGWIAAPLIIFGGGIVGAYFGSKAGGSVAEKIYDSNQRPINFSNGNPLTSNRTFSSDKEFEKVFGVNPSKSQIKINKQQNNIDYNKLNRGGTIADKELEILRGKQIKRIEKPPLKPTTLKSMQSSAAASGNQKNFISNQTIRNAQPIYYNRDRSEPSNKIPTNSGISANKSSLKSTPSAVRSNLTAKGSNIFSNIKNTTSSGVNNFINKTIGAVKSVAGGAKSFFGSLFGGRK